MPTATAVAEHLYRALSDRDAEALSAALSADFHATVSPGCRTAWAASTTGVSR